MTAHGGVMKDGAEVVDCSPTDDDATELQRTCGGGHLLCALYHYHNLNKHNLMPVPKIGRVMVRILDAQRPPHQADAPSALSLDILL